MTSPVKFTAADPSVIKLFVASRVSAHSTLRACYEHHKFPDICEGPASTLVENATVLRHWERLTTNPAVGQITPEILRGFRKRLMTESIKIGTKKTKRSPATVNKILRTLAAMITPLWPADRHNPGGLGLVPFCQIPKPLPRQRTLAFIYSRKQMTALYEAADACVLSGQCRIRSLYNPLLWRTAMVLALNTGPRTWDLCGLKWSDFRWNEFRYGAVYYQSRKTCKFQATPLNRCARAHLDRVRALRIDSDRVFPDFNKGKAFYAAWHRICAKAGVTADFEDFRKTCSTLHDEVERDTGAWLCGHPVRGTNDSYYQNFTRRILKAIYSLKQPKAYRMATAEFMSDQAM
ncbi:tyrosine-type recombinase/integrase [bacterium]|nr:tyrosine-type recombinase/integrase [bacterium]